MIPIEVTIQVDECSGTAVVQQVKASARNYYIETYFPLCDIAIKLHFTSEPVNMEILASNYKSDLVFELLLLDAIRDIILELEDDR